MTEAEWLTCADPTPMLERLSGKTSDRKLRLFAAACCRGVWDLLSNKCRRAVEANERYADGEISRDKLSLAGFRASVLANVEHRREATAAGWAMRAAAEACGPVAGVAAVVELAVRCRDEPGNPASVERVLVSHLRCLFGNPFRPVAFNPDWRTPAAVALARTMYEARDFAHLPILADALEDAGCDHPDVIAHCRGPGPHIRGCWVVDLVLGKE